MFGWYVTKMRNYGLLAQRFRRAYDAIVSQQEQRVLDQIDASQFDDERKQELREWAARVRATEYSGRVPVGAAQVGD